VSDADIFEKIAEDIRTQGYCVYKNAVPETLASALRASVDNLPIGDMKHAGVGRRDDFSIEDDVRRDKVHWIDAGAPVNDAWLGWMDGLKAHLNRRLFLGLFSFESHYAHYPQGGFYRRHVDAFRGQANRVLSIVTYLNPDWHESLGGELLIYADDSDDVLARVLPEQRTLVVFLSEDFPHEVLPASSERFSIAGWFRINGSSAGLADPER